MDKEDGQCTWVSWLPSHIPLLSVFKWQKVVLQCRFSSLRYNVWLSQIKLPTVGDEGSWKSSALLCLCHQNTFTKRKNILGASVCLTFKRLFLPNEWAHTSLQISLWVLFLVSSDFGFLRHSLTLWSRLPWTREGSQERISDSNPSCLAFLFISSTAMNGFTLWSKEEFMTLKMKLYTGT